MIIKPVTPNSSHPGELPTPDAPLVQFQVSVPCDVDEQFPSFPSTTNSSATTGGMGMTQSSLGGSSRLSSQTLELVPPMPMFNASPAPASASRLAQALGNSTSSQLARSSMAAGAPIVLPPSNGDGQFVAPLPSRSMSMANTTAEGMKPPSGMKLRDPNDKGPKQLIVKFLAPQVTEVELRQLFQQFGPVEYSRMIYDPNTGTSKGYGFVYYYRSSDAADAVSGLDSFELYGRYLRVGFAIPQRQPPAPPPL